MAGNRQQFTLQFNADTSQAKKALNELQKSLNKVSTVDLEVAISDSALKKASEAAQDLKKHLQEATNVNTGELNLNTFVNSLNKAGTSVTQLGNALLDAGQTGQAAFSQLASVIASAEVPIKRMNSTLAAWGQTLKNTVKWELSSTMVHGLESALSGAVSYVKDLNSSLTNIRIVTGQSAEDMARFATQANRAARELSTTTKAYADASLIYYQQGDSAEQVAKKAAITIKAANSSFNTSAQEMSEYLTAVWNSYQVGADELERYVDIMAALGAKTATSLEEIATSMQKVAATSNTVGVSMEQVSSIIATVSSVTRESAESIGTAFKTIFARIGDLKLGETLEDGVNLGQVSSQLEKVGVSILDANGELRDMGIIIEDLMAKWGEMGRAEQTAIAQVIAGKRQYTQWMALMENSSMYKSNMSIATNAEGSLQEMADIAAESWEAASRRVQAAWEKIFSSLINDKALVGVTNAIEKIVTTLGGFIDGMGGVAGIVGTVGGALTQAFSDDIANGITKITTKIKDAFTGMNEQTRFLQNSAQMRQELQKIQKDSAVLDPAQDMQINAALKVSEKKDQLLVASKNMSEGQIAQAKAVISAYQEQITALNELMQLEQKRQANMKKEKSSLVDEVVSQEAKARAHKQNKDYAYLNAQEKKKFTEEANKKFLVDAADIKVKFTTDATSTKELEKTVSQLAQELGSSFTKLGFKDLENLTFDQAVTSAQTLVTAFGDVQNMGKQIKQTFGTIEAPELFASNRSDVEILQDLLQYAKELERIGQETGSKLINGQVAKIKGNAGSLEEAFAGDKTKAEIEQLFNLISEGMSKAEAKLSKNVPKIKAIILNMVPPELKNRFEELFQEWEKGGSKLDKLGKDAEEAGEKMEQAFAQAAQKTSKNLNAILDIAGSLESIYGLINSFKGLVDTLKDPEVSGWEKFGAVLGFATTAIMTFIAISQGVVGVLSLFPVAGAAGAAGAGAAGAGAAAATPAVGAFAGAVNAAIWPLTLIVGVLALAAAAFIAFRKEVAKPLTIEEEVTALNEQLDLLTEKIESTKSRINSLEDSFDSYTSVRAALDNCTEGTAAWYSALAEVQNKTLELLSQYPLLAKILDNPTKYFGEDFDLSSLYDENGLINMDLLMTKALEVERQGLGTQKAFAAVAQTEVARRETAMNLQSDNDQAVNMPERETVKHGATWNDWNGWTEEVLPAMVLEYFPHWEDISLQAPIAGSQRGAAYLTNGKSNSISSIGDVSGTINEIMPGAVSLARGANNVPTTQRVFSPEYQDMRDYFTNLGYNPDEMQFDQILDVVLAEAFAYGQENGITNMDNAIVEYIRSLPAGVQKILNYSTGAGARVMVDEEVARTFVGTLHDAGILTGTSESAYGVNYNAYQQSTVSVPQEYRVLASDVLANQSEQGIWTTDQMEFFQTALPHWIEDQLVNEPLDLTSAPTTAELARYSDYLSYYSPEEAKDYNWDSMNFDPAEGVVKFTSKSDSEKTYEVPISTIRVLDKVQEMVSNPMPMLTDLSELYTQAGTMGNNDSDTGNNEGSIFQKLLTSGGDLSVLTGAELKDLQDSEALTEFVQMITSLYGEAAATGLTSENIGNMLSLSWSDSLTMAQQNAIDNLGPYVSSQVKKWLASEEGRGREQELFADGRLVPDLSVISPELASFADSYNSDSGLNALLNFQSQIPALGEIIQKMQDGSLIDQEELDLLTEYTKVAPELFALMGDGYKYVGTQTTALMGQMIKDSNTLYTNLMRFDSEPILDFSNLTDEDKQLLKMLLGLNDDQLTEWLATAGVKEKETVNKNLALLWQGREALQINVDQLGAWYATVTSFSDITDAGLTWEAIPEWAQNMVIQNVATQAGHDLDELQLYDADGKISSETEYNEAVTKQNRAKGFNSLYGMYEDFKTLDEDLKDLEVVDANIEILESLARVLSLIFGVEVTTDWLKSAENWALVANLFNNEDGALDALDAVLNPSSQKDWSQEQIFTQAAFEQDPEKIAQALGIDPVLAHILSSANLEEGYFDIGRNQWNDNKNALALGLGVSTEDGKYVKPSDLSAMEAWGISAGYLSKDEETQEVSLTERGAAIASDVDGFYNAIIAAMNNGTKIFNIASGKFSSNVVAAYNEIIDTVDSNGDFVFDTAEDQESVANILANAENSAGQIGINRMKEMLKAVPVDKLDEFSNALSGVDWTDASSVEAFKDRLEAAGFSLDDPLSTAIDAVATAAQAAAKALMSLAEAANIYKTRTDIADKVREGEALTPEEYAEVISAYAEQEKAKAKADGRELSDADAYKLAEARARSEFEANRWGEYELSNNVNAENWATNLESVAITGFQQILDSVATATDDTMTRDFSDGQYNDRELATAGLIAGNADKFTPYGMEFSDDEIKALLRLSSATTDEDKASAEKELTDLGWDADKWETVLAIFDQILGGIKEEATEALNDANTGTTEDNLNDRAIALGFESLEDLDEYTQHLIDMGEIVDENGEKIEELTDREREYAMELKRQENGFKKAEKSLKDWTKTLTTADKKSEDYLDALDGMRDAYADIFNLSEEDADGLSESFLTSAENAELLEKSIQGDNEAFDQLQANLAKEMVKNIQVEMTGDETVDEFIDYVANYDFGDMKIGATIDDADFNAKLNSMVFNSYDAAAQMSDALSSMGVDAEIVEHTREVPGVSVTRRQTGTYSVPNPNGPPTEYTVSSVIEETQDPHTETYYTLEGATYNGRGVSNGGSNSGGSSGGGGGGGGGSKPKKLDKKKPEDHKERYHETNQTLDRLADELEKIDKLKSRAYGKGHLDAIKQEIGLLKQEIGLQQDYIKQAQAYLKIDKNRVASLGATFNADGTISNYDELIDSIVAKYNAFIEKYNAASASAQEDMEEEKEKMDEWFDEAMEWISQYEDTLNIIRDKENEILELQNEISAKTLEGIQYKVEFEVELNEEEVDFLDYLNEKYSEVLEKQDKMVENLVKQQQFVQENLGYLNNAKAELDAKFASGELNQADYVAGLQDINDQILENLSTLEELRKEIQEAYGNALELASEAIDNHTEKMEHASQAMQSYISIMGLIGKGVDYDKLSDYYDKQYTYNLKSLETQQQYLEVLKEEESYYLAKMAAGDLTETERIQFEALQDTIAEVEDGILSKTEETLSALREAFSIAVEGILRDFEESVAGSGNTLEDLAADYEYYLEVQERHVSTSKELYEISKLNRQIEQDIADTSSSVYKQRLAALQEEIKAKSADRALTEYDIQMMNLEYELLQRQMALEEAKNAKDTVRLTRDSSGNYVYQYTADQDKIAEAQQGVEDVLQQMAEANAERVTQLEQETINTYQNMVSQIEEIANSEVLTQEEKNAKIAEIVAQAQEKMLWLQDQYGIATENTMATNALIQDHYNTDMITNAQISSEAMNETIAAIINKSAELSDGMATMQEQIGQEMAELEYDINTVLNTTAWDDAGEKISAYDDVVDDATTEVDEMIAALSGEDGLLDSIKDTTAAWDAQSAAIDALIKYYEDLYDIIVQTQNAQANTSPTTPGTPGTSDPGTDMEETDEEEPAEDSGKVQFQGGNYQFWTYKEGSGTKGKGQIFHGNGKSPVVTKEDESDGRIKISGEDGDGHTFSGRWISKTYRKKDLWKAYETGGLVDYTGPAWVDGTKENPELMLNATDTQNMLAAVQTVRALDSATLNMLDEFIKLATSSMLSADNLHASGVASTDTELQQQVQITAEFPNVQDSNEIQDAFDNLINRAAQYIGSKK